MWGLYSKTFGSNKAHWGKGLSADDRGNKLPNKRLHLTGIPLRSIPAGELFVGFIKYERLT